MAKITQKQIIEHIKTLKEIKPRQEWVVLLKSQILTERPKGYPLIPVPVKSIYPKGTLKVGIMDVISSIFFQRKLAYTFAVVLFLIVGVFGFARYTVPGDLLFPIKKIAEQSQAALTGQTPLNQDVTALNNRVKELAQVTEKGEVDNIPAAISEVTEAAKDLKNNPTQDPKTLKEIASSYKTLADVPGTDLSGNQDIEDLAQITAQDLITYYQGITLTDNQKIILQDVKNLYNNGDYSGALVEIYTKLNTGDVNK